MLRKIVIGSGKWIDDSHSTIFNSNFLVYDYCFIIKKKKILLFKFFVIITKINVEIKKIKYYFSIIKKKLTYCLIKGKIKY